ncbi:hypothetical protein LXL04_020587 [Taraxacum kok-saghyz]
MSVGLGLGLGLGIWGNGYDGRFGLWMDGVNGSRTTTGHQTIDDYYRCTPLDRRHWSLLKIRSEEYQFRHLGRDWKLEEGNQNISIFIFALTRKPQPRTQHRTLNTRSLPLSNSQRLSGDNTGSTAAAATPTGHLLAAPTSPPLTSHPPTSAQVLLDARRICLAPPPRLQNGYMLFKNLPWMFYHKVIGVGTFFLFVEGKAASPSVSKVLESIPGVRVIYRTKELEEKQATSRIWNETWLSSFFYRPCNYELFVKQSLNMKMAIVMARESSVERDDIKDPFIEVSMFKRNYDHFDIKRMPNQNLR